jgi:hypothetical protein
MMSFVGLMRRKSIREMLAADLRNGYLRDRGAITVHLCWYGAHAFLHFAKHL